MVICVSLPVQYEFQEVCITLFYLKNNNIQNALKCWKKTIFYMVEDIRLESRGG